MYPFAVGVILLYYAVDAINMSRSRHAQTLCPQTCAPALHRATQVFVDR